jgi:hypothetical protein
MVDQCRVAQKEKDGLQAKFEEERAHVKQEKEQLLAEKLGFKEAVEITLLFLMGLEPKEKDRVEHQVVELAEAIQQLQQRITDLELQTMPNTP